MLLASVGSSLSIVLQHYNEVKERRSHSVAAARVHGACGGVDTFREHQARGARQAVIGSSFCGRATERPGAGGPN